MLRNWLILFLEHICTLGILCVDKMIRLTWGISLKAGKSWQWTMIGVAPIVREPLRRSIARTDIQKLPCILDVDALSFPPQNKNP